MKTTITNLIFVTTFLFLFFIDLAVSQSLARNEIDEFTGDRIVQSELVRIEHEGFSGRAHVSAFYNEGSYALILNVVSRDSWQLLSTDSANFLIDGDRHQLDLFRVDTDVTRGNTHEVYAFILTQTEFERFAGAGEVRFRANRNIYTLNQEAIDAFKNVLAELN